MTEEEVRLELRRMLGSQRHDAFARSIGLSPGSLSNMLSGRHGISKRLLDAMGFVAVVDYRRKAEVEADAKQVAERKPKRLFQYGDWPTRRSR